MTMKYELKMEGRIKEMTSRFLHLLVLPLLRWHPSDFSRCHWLPRILAAIFSLEIEP